MNYYLPVCLLFVQAVWAGGPPRKGEALLGAFHLTQHQVQRDDGGGYRADNPENRLSAEFTADG